MKQINRLKELQIFNLTFQRKINLIKVKNTTHRDFINKYDLNHLLGVDLGLNQLQLVIIVDKVKKRRGHRLFQVNQLKNINTRT